MLAKLHPDIVLASEKSAVKNFLKLKDKTHFTLKSGPQAELRTMCFKS